MATFANEMQACYEKQAVAVRQVLASLPETMAAFCRVYGGKAFKRVVLLGIGSSYHALNMACAFGQSMMKTPVVALTPEQLNWLDGDLAKDTLIICASQSGTSTNILACMEKLGKLGAGTAAITQFPDSPVAQAAGCVIPLDIPEEKAGPKTMGVLGTTMLAAFALCEIADPSGEKKKELAALGETFAEMLDENLPAMRQFALDRADVLSGYPSWVVYGQKAMRAPAGEAALKLVETVRVPVSLYELEELIHGPSLCLGKSTALMLVGQEHEELTRPLALCGLCREKGGDAYEVIAAAGKTSVDGFRIQLNSPGHPVYDALMVLLPSQAISAYVPPVMGIDLDEKEDNRWKKILAGHLD